MSRIRCPSHDLSALRAYAVRFNALGVVPASRPRHGIPFASRGLGRPIAPLHCYDEVLRLPPVRLAALRFLRFAVRVTHAPRKTRFQPLVRLYWTGLSPAGFR